MDGPKLETLQTLAHQVEIRLERPPGVHFPTVLQIERVAANGWPNNMFAIPLPNHGAIVHSPTWLGDDSTFSRVEAAGTPRVLFAPNHFHHLSLARFRARYPEAIAVASPSALVRLRAKGHQGLRALADAAPLLPQGARFLACEGLRSGEAWLSFVDDRGRRTLLVGDAFFHVRQRVKGIAGFVLRRLGTLPGLTIGDTFRWLAVSDRQKYRGWATEVIRGEAPRRLAMSHGAVVEQDDLVERLVSLLEARFG